MESQAPRKDQAGFDAGSQDGACDIDRKRQPDYTAASYSFIIVI